MWGCVIATIGTYGYIIPDIGDQSSVEWCPNQRFNWARLDTHNHDGINSAALSSTVVPKTTVLLAAGGWVLVANGIYGQTANIAPALYNNSSLVFFETGGDKLELETVKTGASACTVYSNDSSIDVTVLVI